MLFLIFDGFSICSLPGNGSCSYRGTEYTDETALWHSVVGVLLLPVEVSDSAENKYDSIRFDSIKWSWFMNSELQFKPVWFAACIKALLQIKR